MKADEAKDLGDIKEQHKQMVRNIRVTPQMTEDAMKVLELMGIPNFKANCEAEA